VPTELPSKVAGRHLKPQASGLKPYAMSFAAIIFDCDGTLADTMPVHFEAWQATLARYAGLELSEDRFYVLGGWPTRAIADLLQRETGIDFDAAALSREKEADFESRLDHVRPIEPVVRIVQEYRGKLPIAVATGGTRMVCTSILSHIGLSGWFDAMVCAEDVPRHKPAPDIFLEAARRLGVEAARCRVYEDTDPGLEAARRAGMDAIDVRTFFKPRRVTG
jgi:beta-phosphoglucomutase-like phosphatase (HAD superfamily)